MRNILAYISKDAPLTAKRFVQRIQERVDRLASNPFLGGFISELPTREYRELIQGNYRVIYRTDGKIVRIAMIHHAARLLDTDLLEE